jgi:hypothetical protein
MMPWRPEVPGERPSLGEYVIGWMEENLIVPDGPLAGQPFKLTPEMQRFVLRLYEIDPHGGETALVGNALRNTRIIRRAVISRPKGWGKSPLLGALCLVEALADVVPDGWDADGRPVGRPWNSLGFKPKVQIIAVSEDQTANTWDPVLEMAREGNVSRNYRIEPLETFINVPRGRIEPATSSSRSREGFRPVFAVLDQTETWLPQIGGPKLAAAVRRNLGKTGGCSVESPNAFVPGESSVAEASYSYWDNIQSGKVRGDGGLLYDHREAPPETELADRDSLLAGLEYAYGDSSWVDFDRLIAECWDQDTETQDARRFYLNQITHAADSYISQVEWSACKDESKKLNPGDLITLGFDGSRGRAEGKPDATALVATRVSDGFQYALGIWEAEDYEWEKWTPPLVEIDATVAEAFKSYSVAAFFCDPARDWRSKVNEWEAAYRGKVKVNATRDHPFEWWMTGYRSIPVERAVREYMGAVRNGEQSHQGQRQFTRHTLNARQRVSHQHLTIGKASSASPNKVDACIAAILSWEARRECIAAGIGATPVRKAPMRIR